VTERADPGLARGPRGPDDDFVCHRFEIWYSSLDCAIRTKFQTCPACERCAQGRFNLERHRAALARVRLPLID